MKTPKSMVPAFYRGKTQSRILIGGHYVRPRPISRDEAAALILKYGGPQHIPPEVILPLQAAAEEYCVNTPPLNSVGLAMHPTR